MSCCLAFLTGVTLTVALAVWLAARDGARVPASPKRSGNVRAALLAGLFLLIAVPLASAQTVTLAWDAAVPVAGQQAPDGYVLYRHDALSTTFVEVGRTPAATLTYKDAPGAAQTYWYRVHAYAGTQLSDPSNEVSVRLTGKPAAARNLTVTVTGTGAVKGKTP